MTVEKHFKIMGTEDINVLVSTATADGAFTIFTETGPPGCGPPPHVHTREDEFMMPLDGQFEVFSDEAWAPLARSGFYTARGSLHTWRNSGTAPGTMLFVASPGGFDRFLEDLVPVEMPQQLDLLISISARYGISYPLLQAPPGREEEAAQLHGSMRGSVLVPEGVDLTAPVLDGTLDAEQGIPHG